MCIRDRYDGAEYRAQLIRDTSSQNGGDGDIMSTKKRRDIKMCIRDRTNTDRSFKLSETLINDFAIKKLDEFKTAVKEKLKNLS